MDDLIECGCGFEVTPGTDCMFCHAPAAMVLEHARQRRQPQVVDLRSA